jgi:hypothetical protein
MQKGKEQQTGAKLSSNGERKRKQRTGRREYRETENRF